MNNKALVALDISPAEMPLLDCLQDLTSWGISEVVLLHVMPLGYMQGVPMAHEQDYIDWLQIHAAPLREAGLVVSVEIVASGKTAQTIINTAADCGAGLVVIGSRGQNLLKRMFLGGTSREVLRNSPLPVLLQWIEPDAEATSQRCQAVCRNTLQHVMIATDFSANAATAEDTALQLASRANRIDCLHVLAPNDCEATLSHSAASAALTSLSQRLTDAGNASAPRLLSGDKPSLCIAEHAEDAQASLIIVGKRGHGHISSIVIGSTAANLCEMAGRPVLMVPCTEC